MLVPFITHEGLSAMAMLTIGRLAQLADVNVETIRYYQRIGLIPEPARPLSGFRRYGQTDLQRLLFIKRAQRLGFTLNEITELLSLGPDQCADVRATASAKRDTIDRKIKDLLDLRDTLDTLIADCGTGQSGCCPIVTNLSSHA